jgi:hypothetical protein
MFTARSAKSDLKKQESKALPGLVLIMSLTAFIGLSSALLQAGELSRGLFYTPNFPKQVIGITGFDMLTTGLGIGFGVRQSVGPSTSRNFYDNISRYEAETIYRDRNTQNVTEFFTGYVFIMLRLANHAIIYLGPGWSKTTSRMQFMDNSHTLSSDGLYWIEDTQASSTRISGSGGLVLSISSRFAMMVGYESRPSGVTLGIGLGRF